MHIAHSVSIACALHLFYKKNFLLQHLIFILPFLLSPLLHPHLPLLLLFPFIYLHHFSIQDCFNFVLGCTFIYNYKWMLAIQWPYFLLLIQTQTIRNPTNLRSILRPIRIACGPVLTLLMLGKGFEAIGKGPVKLCLGIMAMIACIIGGVIMRPDNLEVWRIVEMGCVKNYKQVHGVAMLVAGVLTLLLSI